MMNKEKMMGDYERTKKVILSCQNIEQLRVGVKMFNQLNKLHALPDKELDVLENLIGLMRIKLGGDVNEGKSQIGKEFHKAAQASGVNDLKGIVFSEDEEIIGGVADNMGPEDLAEKHGVNLKDIKKEINVGMKIEMEHTDSKKMAKEIAIDHIFEFADYYTDPKYGIVAIENKKGEGRKTIRVSKTDMDKLHNKGSVSIDGFDISYKDDGEIEEGTSAMSSGSFVAPFGGGPISRTFKKSEIPVSVGGIDKPIGKMYSYRNEEKEIIEEEDELEEASSAGSVGGQYVTPKFWAKGKGEWRNRVKKTYPGGKFVNIKKKCKNYPYCDQGSGGPSGSPITLTDTSQMEIDGYFNESRVVKTIKKGKLKIKK
jgi:hypothetical protein